MEINQDFKQAVIDKVIETKGQFTVPLLHQLLEEKDIVIPKKTLYPCFQNEKASENTLNKVAAVIDFANYNHYLKSIKKTEQLTERLIGEWISYRFSKTRRIRSAKWKIDKGISINKLIVEKVTKDSIYKGHITIKNVNSDFMLFIELEYSDTHLVYSWVIDTTKIANGFKEIVLNLTYKKSQDVYFSNEVLFRFNEKNYYHKKPRDIHGKIPLKLKESDSQYSEPYRAYNFLSVAANHNRVRINKDSGLYNHSIFISCPVRSLVKRKCDKFEEIVEDVKKVYDILKKAPFQFNEDSIHCEILKKRNHSLNIDSSLIYEQSRGNINKTHFIAFLPEELGGANTATYLEIYYRISKKLPCLVFYHPSLKKELPHTFRGFIERKRQNNVEFKELSLKEVPEYLKTNGLDILSLNIY